MASAPPQTSPLLRIRAGIEAGNASEVIAGVTQADSANVTLAPNVREMIKQWLSVNAPDLVPASLGGPVGTSAPPAAVPTPAPAVSTPPPVMTPPAMTPPAMTPPTTSAPVETGASLKSLSSSGQIAQPEPTPEPEDDEGVKVGEGTKGWSTSAAETGRAIIGKSGAAPSWEILRIALMKVFGGAPKGSDAAFGLGILEGEEGDRYLPFTMLGKAVNMTDSDDIARSVQRSISQAKPGVFSIAPDGTGVGLLEWAGWQEFSVALAAIRSATRDPAFEPKSIQGHIARAARGAVRASGRQADALQLIQESLSPQDKPEGATPALRSAISRRTRLALACLCDGLAAAGLAPEAGPDAMGLVGQLPRTLFGPIFDDIDNQDRGACAFLSEILQSWDRRRCFSKRWLQDAASKFNAPKGANSERDEGKGWYALTADNAHRMQNGAPPVESVAIESTSSNGRRTQQKDSEDVSEANHKANKKRGIVQDNDDEPDDDDAVNKKLEESRKRRAALMAKYGEK